jgi:2',3'-cyclic-nucleotide 2'-phosphodiesterase
MGDVVGKPGRQAICELLPRLKADLSPDFTIANAENAAGGIGITRETAHELLDLGVDALTLGNHGFAKKEVYQLLDSEPRILRPANYPAGAPGRGWAVYTDSAGESIGLMNLCGRVFMAEHLDDPFRTADRALKEISADTRITIVDFHAEVTSEKSAFSCYVDGRATAVIGTHTHVQTADERILPGGTASITDVGMTGPEDSVLGVRKELIVSRFLTQMPNKFEVAEGPAVLSAVLIDADPATGKSVGIRRIYMKQSSE